MNNRNFLIFVAPGLALFLLISLRGLVVSASLSAPVAFQTTGIAVEKAPSEQAVVAGETATFTITITNHESVALDLVVEDPIGDPNCVVPPLNTLEPNGTISYICTVTNVTSDIINVITVTGTNVDGTSVQDSSSAMVEAVDAAIGAAITPTTQTVAYNGTASYEVTITNTGAVALDVNASTLYGNGDCPPSLVDLIPGRSTTFTCSVANVTSHITDFVTVTGRYTTPSGLPVQVGDYAQAFISSAPIITVTKTAVPSALPEPGGVVSYSIGILNGGSVTVTLFSLVDDMFGDLRDPANLEISDNNCPAIVSIGPGDQAGCSFKAMVNGVPGSQHINTVTAEAEEEGSELQTTDDDSAAVAITDVSSSIVTTLTAAPMSVPDPGGDVTFSVRVKNTSAVDTVTINSLTGDSPLDNLDGKGNCQLPRTLIAGASFQCSVTAMISGTSGQGRDFIVIANGTDDDGLAVTDSSNAVTITITGPDITEIFLPVIVRNNDAAEPNNGCAAAHPMSINSDHLFFANDKEDWYRFELAGAGNLVVELSNFVPITGQIIVYRGSCPTPEFVMNNGNFLPTKIVNVGPAGPGTFFIRVITDGPFSATPYKLHVHFS